MATDLSPNAYRDLVEFRRILHTLFLADESFAQEANITWQQCLALLTIKAPLDGKSATVGLLAQWLGVERFVVDGLVDDLVRRRFVERSRDPKDRRRVLLTATPIGEQWLTSVADEALSRLVATGPTLLKALRNVMAQATEHSERSREPQRLDVGAFAWRSTGTQAV
jgi:DNA-binding MarR family transcriptional regulator